MAIKHLQFDDSGTIEFGSLTTNYQDLLSLSDDADFLFFWNSTDSAVVLKLPSGTSTKELRIPAGASFAVDCRTNSKRLAKGIVQVKRVAAVTEGEVTVFVAR